MKNIKRTQWILMILGCLVAAIIGGVLMRQMNAHLRKLDADIDKAQQHLHSINEQTEQNKVFQMKWQDIRGFQDKAVEVQGNLPARSPPIR